MITRPQERPAIPSLDRSGATHRLARGLAVLVLHLALAPVAAAQTPDPSDDAWKEHLRTGHRLSEQKRFQEAETEFTNALREAERFGLDDRRVASCLNSLALLYQSRDNAGAAEPLFRRAVGIVERDSEPGDPEVGKAYFNLGEFYRRQQRFEDADKAFAKWLAIFDTESGPAFLPTLNYLALAHFVDRRFDPAEKYVGPDNPQTARSWSDLGVVYLAVDKHADAEQAFRRSLAIREKTTGAESDTAMTLGHLATTYIARLQLAEAERLFHRSLELHQATPNANRQEHATVLNNLGEYYRQQLEFEQAERYLSDARRMWEEVVGAEHPETATTLYNLASLYQRVGRRDEAAPLLQQSVQVFERTLGTEHPKTSLAKNALAAN